MNKEGRDQDSGFRIQGKAEEEIQSPIPKQQATSNKQQPSTALYAGIDVGTNSVKMIIADLADGRADRVFEQTVLTRLGEGMQAQGNRLREAAMRRTLDALAELVEAARAHNVRDMVGVGTAALRDAENRDDFLRRAHERLGLSIDVIPGEEEARLSYLAVRRDPHWRAQPRLRVIDIGGGSTEVIEGTSDGDTIASRISVNYGAVKLTEQFLRSDPPTIAQLEEANRAVQEAFARIPDPAPSAPTDFSLPAFSNKSSSLEAHLESDSEAETAKIILVGVGGTVTNLGAMDQSGKLGDERLHGHLLTADRLGEHIDLLATRTVAQRTEIPGLDPRRADIILGGAILLAQALARLNATSLAISTRGLRWGLLYDRFQSP